MPKANRRTIENLMKIDPRLMEEWGEQLVAVFRESNRIGGCIERTSNKVFLGRTEGGKKVNPLKDIATVNNLDNEGKKLALAINTLYELTQEANSLAASHKMPLVAPRTLGKQDMFLTLLESYGMENANILSVSGVLDQLLRTHDEKAVK